MRRCTLYEYKHIKVQHNVRQEPIFMYSSCNSNASHVNVFLICVLPTGCCCTFKCLYLSNHGALACYAAQNNLFCCPVHCMVQ